MKEKEEHIDDLIAKQLAEGLNSEEKTVLNTWLNSDIKNQKYFDELSEIWLLPNTGGVWAPNEKETELAWEVVKKKTVAPVKVIKFPQYLAMAASFALVISLGFWFYSNSEPDSLLAQSERTPKLIRFNDGSTAMLHSYSSIAYPEEFSDAAREVELNGSATFDVARNKQSSFRVSAGESIIEVLGTKFTVNQSDDSVFVYVKEGSVELKSDFSGKQESVVIPKGQSGSSTPKNAAKSYNLDVNKLKRNFLFENANLSEVLLEIELAYFVAIDVKDQSFLDCTFSAKITQYTLEEMLQNLRLVFGVDYSIKGKSVNLMGKGC